MKAIRQVSTVVLALGTGALACGDWDNPAALSELEPQVEFEVGTARVETFEEVELHVHVTESGAPLQMLEAEVEIEPVAGGPARIAELAPEGEGYAAHVMFFEPGEHHLHFRGIPELHRLLWEMGEAEIEVHRLHKVIGPYWVELEIPTGMILEGTATHVHVLAFQLLDDGTQGDPVAGLDLELEIHDTGDVGTLLAVTEGEPGKYETEYAFGDAGIYELHVEIEVGAEHAHGEFQIPVFISSDSDVSDEDEGGHAHDH